MRSLADYVRCLIFYFIFIQVGRIWWTLARDNVTPFSSFFSRASVKWSCPIEATIFCCKNHSFKYKYQVGHITHQHNQTGIISLALGAISLGSKTAFSDLVGSFIILTTVSYICAILPHLLSGRSNVPQGPFWMGNAGYWVNGIAVLMIIFTNVMYCFPYAFPVTVQLMNYNSVILAGCTLLTVIWWFVHGRTKYPGPRLPHLDEL